MRRLWIIVALLLSACATPTEPPPPTNTPTPTQPTPTLTSTSTPTNTPTVVPTRTPTDTPIGAPGLTSLLFGKQEVWSEIGIGATGLTPTDLRPELVESGNCPVDCAGFLYSARGGGTDITIILIAYENEAGATTMVWRRAQESLANSAREVHVSPGGYGVDFLPEGNRVFYLDQAWSVFAPYGNIFVGVTLEYTLEMEIAMPEDDIISFSRVTAQLASAQIERLFEAGQ